jgi:hypothetical protein
LCTYCYVCVVLVKGYWAELVLPNGTQLQCSQFCLTACADVTQLLIVTVWYCFSQCGSVLLVHLSRGLITVMAVLGGIVCLFCCSTFGYCCVVCCMHMQSIFGNVEWFGCSLELLLFLVCCSLGLLRVWWYVAVQILLLCDVSIFGTAVRACGFCSPYLVLLCCLLQSIFGMVLWSGLVVL